jgi:hypothetical protein
MRMAPKSELMSSEKGRVYKVALWIISSSHNVRPIVGMSQLP